ncbi:epoxyqueuosine reductase QueH [uncultured Ruminococcus sp.]|uniref:epoxyqueuosine reductase QueH n=1 Tax=uncultured Ruminococcus sp. TaxID=165186 RepID=UPI0025FDCA49|nr:epoxyqueuosine reductase QueH [uncultured Ruminococcus sp.]
MPEQKINYGLLLDKKIAELEKSGERPSLLLHACCAPCSSHTLTVLYKYFRITLYFCNPNIAPEEEYVFRLNELKRLVREMGLDIPIIEEDYDSAPFYELAKGLEDLPERGERCKKCIGYRLRKAGEKAKELGCDFFTTTLTISPHKDCAFINVCGGRLQDEVGVAYLFSDFKKHEGYKHSIELSRQYDLYRQNYCGCVFSKK